MIELHHVLHFDVSFCDLVECQGHITSGKNKSESYFFLDELAT